MTVERLGDALAHLELVQVIGGGPAGLVYEAFDPRQGRRVALKTFRLDALDTQAADAFEARLRADTDAGATLRHPNIVEVYGCDRSDQTASLAMEFVEGETLAQHLARVGKRPPLQALALVAQLASALECAHGQGLAHGRIAPEHLLVSRTGQLKLAGFGIPAAPEQAFRDDLSGMATLAHQLFTGAGSAEPRGELPPPHQLRPELPAALDSVFARALAPDPQSRYPSPAALFDAMRAAFEPPLWERAPKAAAVASAVAPAVAAPISPSAAPAVPPAAPPAVPRAQRPAADPAAVAPLPAARQPAAKRPQPPATRGRKRLALVAASLVGVLVIGGVVLSGSFGGLGASKAELEQIAAASGPSTSAPASTAPVAAPAEESPAAAAPVPPVSVVPDARTAAPAAAPAEPRARPAETAATATDTRPAEPSPEPRRARERMGAATSAQEEPAPSRVAAPVVASPEPPAVRREPERGTSAASAASAPAATSAPAAPSATTAATTSIPSTSPTSPTATAAAPALPATSVPAPTATPVAPAAQVAPGVTAGTNTAGAGPSPVVPPAAGVVPGTVGTSVASIERPPAGGDAPQVVLRAVVRNDRPQAQNDPEAACRHQQLLIAREICNVAQCQEPQWRNHPTCVRRMAEQRQRDEQADEAFRTQ